jgi:phosphohistidine phosphatase
MKLYLIRHGEAAQAVGGKITSDAQRPLTEEGRVETRQVASGLRRLSVKPDIIFSSPLVRAYQTAEIFADVFGMPSSLHVTDSLAPGANASDIYKFIRDFKQFNEAFLVGHEPDMGRLAATLLWAGPELDMPFKKAGICRIDISSIPPTSPGTLKWFITPKLATLMAGMK